jgi:uncharacterized protein YigA (DUF484 family)
MTDDTRTDASAPDPARGDAQALSADAVADWLRQHPEFFEGREALLADLVLPHGSDGTVSLVERQLGILRERNADMRGRLNELVRTARVNHRLFERTLELTVHLIEAEDTADLLHRFVDGLGAGFDVDATRVLAVDAGGLSPGVRGALPVTADADAREAAGNLMRPGRIVCGRLREAELAFLFGETSAVIASAAVMPVAVRGGTLLVALGSADADHFTPDMGTLFIRFLGDSLGRLLAREQRLEDAAARAAPAAAAADAAVRSGEPGAA